MANINDYTNYLVYLCRCAVNGENPCEGFPEELDFEGFFRFCYDHQLVGLAYDMLSRIKTGYENTDMMLIFKDKHNYAVLKDASQDYYLGLIKDAFTDNKIDFVTLKGSVIKNLYPMPYYRQCTDMDILIRIEDRNKAKKVMESIGFEAKSFNDNEETDVYRIDKYVCVELHKQLIPEEASEFLYCNSILKRLLPTEKHEYVMTDEDYYLFMIAHISKHLKLSSVGIRAILDIWIYLKSRKELDWRAIESELDKCGLKVTHQKLKRLVDYWFEDEKPDEEMKMISEYIGKSGWNGTDEHAQARMLDRVNTSSKSKKLIQVKHFFKTTFASKNTLRGRYQILNKHAYMLPACWLHRAFSAAFNRKDNIKQAMHYFDTVDMNKMSDIENAKHLFGLK